jgi:cytochrome P450
MVEIFKRISAGNPADYIPIAKLAGRPKSLDELQHYVDTLFKHIESWIAHHKETLDPKAPRDFCDEMLINQAKSGITDTDILIIIWDAMAGGIDTSATSFEWLIYLLINYPKVQEKMQAELDRVVGPNRLPVYADREKLPYCNAVICELFRYKHFAPFGIPHHTLRDTTLGGYNIPKDTQVMFNFFSMGINTECWDRPLEFRPERFLEEEKAFANGFLDAELKPTVESFKFLPFGAGKRMCVGFGLGRLVMWMKAVTHVHCFKWEQGSKGLPDIDTEWFGVTIVPNESEVKVSPRPAAKHANSIEDVTSGVYRTM